MAVVLGRFWGGSVEITNVGNNFAFANLKTKQRRITNYNVSTL